MTAENPPEHDDVSKIYGITLLDLSEIFTMDMIIATSDKVRIKQQCYLNIRRSYFSVKIIS